jgi:mono/diheme cytochrome c family protein
VRVSKLPMIELDFDVTRCRLVEISSGSYGVRSTSQFRRSMLIFFVSAAVQFGCTAAQKPSKMETTLANMAKDVVIPIQAEGLQNPLAKTDVVLQQGQQLYNQYCAFCHDTDGHAQTKLAQAMYPPAMDLTSPHVQGWGDAELFWIIQNGVRMTGMPSWKGILSDEDSWKLVVYIRALTDPPAVLQPKPAPPPQTQRASISDDRERERTRLISYGKTLYRQEGCFMCHQLNGEGGKVGPDLSTEGERGRTDEWLEGHFKQPSAFSKGSLMPAFKNLKDDQLHSLVAFLQNQKKSKKTSSSVSSVKHREAPAGAEITVSPQQSQESDR